LLYRNTLIRVLATSREALRISGECVIPTPPLATLPEGGVITLAQARASAAEGLFLDRAAACLGEMHPTDADAAIISELCRRLDGLALAIELVAGQIDQFGLGGLLRLIGDPLQLANQARRGGLARHASLAACVEWSLRTLSVAEYAVLRRLAALPERFRLTEAIDAAGHEAPAALLSLEARSLVLADSTTGEPTFRLPAITRAVVLAAGADWPARPETSQPGTAQTP
jgi:predicted ATPase